MKQTVLILLLDKYADWEGAYVSSLLLAMAGDRFDIKTVSIQKEAIKSMGGFTTLPDYDIENVPKDFHALILIGGLSWRTEEAKLLVPFVLKAVEDKKIVGAICDASAFLGTIGVLNKIEHTSNDINDLSSWAKEAYTGSEKYIKKPAVRGENIITANGTAALEFAKEILLALHAAGEDKIEAWYNFHKKGFYEAGLPSV